MKCKNCESEHDGNYGTGLFCSEHCRYSYISKQVKNRKTPFIKGNQYSKGNSNIVYNYICPKCKEKFSNKKEYNYHLRLSHNNMCEYCLQSFENVRILGAHKSHCKMSPNYLKNLKNIKETNIRIHKGKTYTEEEKENLSKKLREYYLKHPDLVPYKRNHHRIKESYPERYFRKVFKIEKFPEYKQEYYFKGYFLDIAYPEKKIDIEINGSQHYVDERIVKHDIKRKKFLHDNGWTFYCINWSKYLKLNRIQKRRFIQGLKLKIL